jgi:site-specific DNA-methyltransferase (adenine-specific)
MRWLVRLVTRPGGLVLDPYCGSGTPGVACVYEGFEFIGIDENSVYTKDARARIDHVVQDTDADYSIRLFYPFPL